MKNPNQPQRAYCPDCKQEVDLIPVQQLFKCARCRSYVFPEKDQRDDR